MIIFFKLLFFLIIINSFALGTDYGSIDSLKTTIIIDSIIIKGNDITEESIIRRELNFAEGDTVNVEILAFNRERVYSMNIFTQVEFKLASESDKNILLIVVNESWYIWPIPFLDFKDGDWGKPSYGIDLSILNFRGMNETVGLRFGLGFDPSFRIYYIVPNLIWKDKILFDFFAEYKSQFNRSNQALILHGSDFEQKFISSQISIGKRFDLFNRLIIYTGFIYAETPFYINGISSSGGRIDRSVYTGIRGIHDTRDLAQFPREGDYLAASFEIKGIGISGGNYTSLRIDARHYEKIDSDFGFKLRYISRHLFGDKIPTYDYSFIGYTEKVRGHFNRRIEGEYSLFGSAEITYPIISEWNLKFDLPVIPSALTSYRIMVYSSFFFDTGLTRFRNQTLRLKEFYSGFGVGLTFLVLPYNIGRIEFAFDGAGNNELILDLGVSF